MTDGVDFNLVGRTMDFLAHCRCPTPVERCAFALSYHVCDKIAQDVAFGFGALK